MSAINAGGSAAQVAKDIAAKHAGAETAALIEQDTLNHSIIRVFARAGHVNAEGNLQWDRLTPSEPDVSLVGNAVLLDFGDVRISLTLESVESLCRTLVSVLEVSRARELLSSGPVAELLQDFMGKFGKPE